ncbi:LuxR C-terminal-related transcriptional regulator [Paenibacillus chitinolyticus]|uniref:LuxR C-terminal-related transcriptional regulator n=1 Tax=Paenibacillus chitinolyticus TaxID=79263 RepID=UPI002DBBFE87|nr:LuxR C-terminal-related transcriptional regulator [Paenibacillus chitinolyticus]MEC0246511.1 LuxR C-terminal-related transcriptional regulator [Paenibacillus chitinolyticus]
MPQKEDALLTEPLLHAKIGIPRTVSALIRRPRLEKRLEEALDGNVTLVCAPAGSGKTTLVGEWITGSGMPAAWVSLDAGDNRGARFWRYIASAVDEAVPGYLEEVSPVLPLLHTERFEQGLIFCLNALSRLKGRLLLVLDDFHVIREPHLLQAVAYFAGHLPAQVHMCILSRTEPGFAVTRMEARQLAGRLNDQDLRFTEREGAEFFDRCELELNEESASALVRKTEGWVTGLKLAAIALRREEEKEPFIREFAGDTRQVKRYLLEEVFGGLSERMKRFLLRSSILKRWNASLCRAVTGFEESRDLIAELESSHLFVIALDNRGDWFRFHHLFSEFLVRRLDRESGEEKEPLFREAGTWCRAQGLEEEAVEYFLQGRYYAQAIELLEEMTSRVVDWEWSHLRKWLSSIPGEILLRHPVLFFSYANSLVAEEAGDAAEGEALLLQAEAWFASASETMSAEQRHVYLAMSHYVKGTLMVFARNDLERAREHYEKVTRYAPDGIRIIFGLPEKPIQAVTVKSYKIGRGHASRAIAEPYTMQMAELYRAVNPVFLGRLFLNHAEVLYYWNDLQGAAQYSSQAMVWIGQSRGRPEHDLVPGWVLQARLLAAEGRLFEAMERLEDGRRRMLWMEVPRGADILEMEKARLQLQSGNPGPALEWRQRCRLGSGDRVTVFGLYDYQLLARVLVHEQRWEEAGALLEKLLYLAESEMRPIDAAEIRSVQADMLLARGLKPKALLQLEEALRISEANDFVRIFLDESAPMRSLLAELAAAKQQGRYRGPDAATLGFVRKILAGMDPGLAAGAASSPLEALLTAREMDVYQGLLDRLSGSQIAQKLGVAYETVKTHRSRIYAKLGVRNRDEAIRRARELEW